MNKKKIIDLVALSSNRFLLLFCCLIFSKLVFCISDPIQDTIIIDGKTVVVNRIVEYEEPIPEPEEPDKKKKKKGNYFFLVDFWGGATFGKIKSTNDKYTSLSEFIDKKNSISQFDYAHVGLGKELNNEFSLQVGVGISYFSLKNQYFTESSLHDSLDHFESFKAGELSQIVIFDYDIGSEMDTLDTELINSNFTQTSLSIPLILRWTSEANSRQKLKPNASVGLIGDFVISHTGGPFVVFEENNTYEYINNKDLNLKRFQLLARFGLGFSTAISRRAEFVTDAHFILPLSSLHRNTDLLKLQYFQLGLSIGLRVNFPSY